MVAVQLTPSLVIPHRRKIAIHSLRTVTCELARDQNCSFPFSFSKLIRIFEKMADTNKRVNHFSLLRHTAKLLDYRQIVQLLSAAVPS